MLDGGQPVAGLVRVTNLATGRALSFADEIDKTVLRVYRESISALQKRIEAQR